MTKVIKLKGFVEQNKNFLNLYLLVLSAYKFGLILGPTKCRPDLDPNCLMVFMKKVFETLVLKNVSRGQKFEKFPTMQRVHTEYASNNFDKLTD